MAKLHEMMFEVSSLVCKYKMVAEVEKAKIKLALIEGRDPYEIRMLLRSEQPDILFTFGRGNCYDFYDLPINYDLKVYPKGWNLNTYNILTFCINSKTQYYTGSLRRTWMGYE